MDLPVLDISYKWNHIVSSLFFHLTSYFQALILWHQVTALHYFLSPKNTLLCGCIPHFIYPLISFRHLGSSKFWFLNVMLPIMWMYKFLYGHTFSFLFVRYLGVELLGHVIILCFNLLRNFQTVSAVAALFYISTSSVWGFQLLHIFINSGYYLSYRHLRGFEVASYCGFDLPFSND